MKNNSFFKFPGKWTWTILIVFGTTFSLFSQQSSHKLIRISSIQKSDVDNLKKLNVDFAYQGLKNHVDIIANEEQLESIKKSGLNFEILPDINKANLYDLSIMVTPVPISFILCFPHPVVLFRFLIEVIHCP